jgi:hypothetical protein
MFLNMLEVIHHCQQIRRDRFHRNFACIGANYVDQFVQVGDNQAAHLPHVLDAILEAGLFPGVETSPCIAV